MLLLTTLALTTLLGPATASVPFNFTHIFNASLSLGKPSSSIPVPGGVLVNEPITNGTVAGSAINGTILGGFAHPPIYNDGTLQAPIIEVYGVTKDNESFYIHETGIGSNEAQVTRIEINVGGTKYQSLVDDFILASVNANTDRSKVNVQGFLVQNTLA
ncbi:hypothetical protein LTR70_005965 [Exophiala xenobiotica]|uniref:Uncharacterized protein n=1 Tax=Lithohypha guttulata TaxID=1690604 RepID=A0ABR0K6P5_9EURO|nr:hypothetical protein LTR24_006173 [Lithohypha guttulata]KAK5317225.1 hypothetical protein LTR70_005965 [Exophiala xenobiotica]